MNDWWSRRKMTRTGGNGLRSDYSKRLKNVGSTVQAQWRTCGLLVGALLLVVSVANESAQATSVTPVGKSYKATSVGVVTFETASTPAGKISCEPTMLKPAAEIIDSLPNSESDPNKEGSVITDLPNSNKGFASFFNNCKFGGEVMSGGAGGIITVNWNVFGSPEVRLAAMSFSRSAFHFYNSKLCGFTIGRYPVQSIIGLWTNGTGSNPSVVEFLDQSLYAEATAACGLPAFDQMRFTATFHVTEPATKTPVFVVQF